MDDADTGTPQPADEGSASGRASGWGRGGAAMLLAMLLAGTGVAWYSPGDGPARGGATTFSAAAPTPAARVLPASRLRADARAAPAPDRSAPAASPNDAAPPTAANDAAPPTAPPVAATPPEPDPDPEPEPDPAELPPPSGDVAGGDGAVDSALAETLELDAELAGALTGALAGSDVADQVSVAVVAADGEVVFGHRADQPRMPASSAKLVTAAAVVEAFGVDHRLTTEAVARGRVVDGVLHGDLVVVGAGDPALAHPDFERVLARWPRTRLEDLADRVAAAVDRITGDVVADTHAWPEEQTASGWPQRYLDRGHARHMSALMVNAGTEIVERDSRTLAVPVTDPAVEAVASLRALLVERDVDVGGAAVRRDGPVEGPTIATVTGHRLEVVMAEMLRRSDNVLADGLWRAAGAQRGDGSWAGAARWGRSLLRRAGADTDGVVLADGSGLSRHYRVTAAHLAQLDAAMARSERAAAWTDLMDKAGDARHLRRRLAGGDAHDAVRAKTGTLRDVRSLAGHVTGDAGRWHVAVVADGLTGGQPWQALDLIDQVVELLARHAKGCELAGCPAR